MSVGGAEAVSVRAAVAVAPRVGLNHEPDDLIHAVFDPRQPLRVQHLLDHDELANERGQVCVWGDLGGVG